MGAALICITPSRRGAVARSADAVDEFCRAVPLRSRKSAAIVGSTFLRQQPARAGAGDLAAALRNALRVSAHATADGATMRDRLRLLIRDEFGRGDVVYVDGWMLSRSEARLYALLAAAGRH
jgi:hypothetical protein